MGRLNEQLEENKAMREAVADVMATWEASDKEFAKTFIKLNQLNNDLMEKLNDRKLNTAIDNDTINIAIIVGHDDLVQGAYSTYLQKTEWAFWNEQVRFYTKQVSVRVVPIYRDRRGITSAHEQIEKSKTAFDAIIELHFNAFHASSANGAEILVNEDLRARYLADRLLNLWTRRTKMRRRRVFTPRSNERGFRNVLFGSAGTSYFLIEPFFGSSPDDVARISSAFLNKNENIVEWWVTTLAALIREQRTDN